jgi:hypothetical protein
MNLDCRVPLQRAPAPVKLLRRPLSGRPRPILRLPFDANIPRTSGGSAGALSIRATRA